jgi:arabinose-5-phosphate isomerase
MSQKPGIVDRGRRVLRLERDALSAALDRLDDSFARAVNLLRDSKGRVIVSGVGKSGLIGRKIAATLTSTGTPAAFLHPTDGLHGDLGIVGSNDVAILISKSGESGELNALIEHLKRLDVPIGDALAVALLEEKGFTRERFAALHPGGSIGAQLLTNVDGVMERGNLPVLHEGDSMLRAIELLGERRGIAIMVDREDRIVGVMTAGDLTRAMESGDDIRKASLDRVLNPQPKVARHDELASAVVFRMEKHGIMAMPVLGADDRLVGVVHLHDLMRARLA